MYDQYCVLTMRIRRCEFFAIMGQSCILVLFAISIMMLGDNAWLMLPSYTTCATKTYVGCKGEGYLHNTRTSVLGP
jgi:hypothetical protein